jgi:Transglutaminase-like superfamily/Coenzyme PQQ synthesis protein D (PqqD)
MGAATFTLCEGVVHVAVEDGTSRLLNLGNHFYGLSVVATRMLRVTLEAGLDAAVESLSEEYGIPPERIRDDLTALLLDLERKRLIRRSGERRIATWLRRFVIYAIIIPTLWVVCLVPSQRGKTWLLLGLSHLSCRLFGWANTVEAWRTGCPLLTKSAFEPEEAMQTIHANVCLTAASHLLPVECKERALTTWALGRIAGIPIKLVVGVHIFPLEGHCWCDYKGTVYSDDSERCMQFKPVWWCS